MKLSNAFKPSKKVKFSLPGNTGYDNPRENIDPHIKTKVISTKEIDHPDFKTLTNASNADTLHKHNVIKNTTIESVAITTGTVLTVTGPATADWGLLPVKNIFKTAVPITGTIPTASGESDALNFISTDGSLTIEGDITTDTLDFEIDQSCAHTWTNTHTWGSMTIDSNGRLYMGGLRVPTSIKSANYTATYDDYFLIINTAASNRTLNLPDTSARNGTVYRIIKYGAANTLTIDPSGAYTIDGAATKALTTNLHCIEIICYAGNWFTTLDNQ